MNIQWYPGHMTKARRDMQESMKLIDLVIELVDARLPLSSRNPDIDDLAKGKSRIIVLTRADMADDGITAQWEKYFTDAGMYALHIDSRKRSDVKRINPVISKTCARKIERDRKRGIRSRPVRAIVAGIPNVGKSTFINSFAGRSSAKTGNKPGVTRGNQWIKAGKNVEMLDTPGLLWPKFDDEAVGIRLAVSGSINDEIINKSELAIWLISYLDENYPDSIRERYGVQTQGRDHFAVLSEIAVARNCLRKGAQPDTDRMASLLLDDFRSGRLGKISLERPL